MADTAPGPRPRPISPSVGVWRWHITMAASILHRATGFGLYIGALVVMAWALSLASGPDAYGAFVTLAQSIPGKIVLFGLTVCVFYHMANGVRHLAWDAGYGFKTPTANTTAWAAIIVAVLASVALWALIVTSGGV